MWAWPAHCESSSSTCDKGREGVDSGLLAILLLLLLKMVLQTHVSIASPSSFPISVYQFQHHPSSSAVVIRRSRRVAATSKNNLNDVDLASDLAKIRRHKEEAMKRSREVLFSELCRSLDSEADQVCQRWMKMSQNEKLGVVKDFLTHWGSDFHPLSARSVKDMVEEHLQAQSSSTSDLLLPRFKRMIGLLFLAS